MLYDLLKPWLFRRDPEAAHELVSGWLATAQSVPLGTAALAWAAGRPPAGLEVEALGLRFPNPLGLAAGFDKECRLTKALPALGFGFLELGSVTLEPQPGNPKPRVFRLPEHEALINRLGFPSGGVVAAADALKRAGRARVPIGINLGLNKDCPPDDAARRYAETFKALSPYGDYFAVNVSSPNTEGLRELQERRHLESILDAIEAVNAAKKPILVKISPDLSDRQLEDLVVLAARRAAGIIATNTTLSREGLPGDYPETRGGLSGAPLRARATHLIRRARSLAGSKCTIIGVGGISTGADAFEKIAAGANLVQLYTSLIFKGPTVVVDILNQLKTILSDRGFTSVASAVGSSVRQVSQQ